MRRYIAKMAMILCMGTVLLSGCQSTVETETGKVPENNNPESTHNVREEATLMEKMEKERGLASFSSVALDGMEYTEELFEGKDITAINFWSLSCGPCVSEMPDLAEFEKALPENAQMLTFCVDGINSSEEIEAFLKEVDYTGITLLTASGDLAKFAGTIQYLPSTVFVNENGSIIGDLVIGSQEDFKKYFKETMNELLKEMGKDTIS